MSLLFPVFSIRSEWWRDGRGRLLRSFRRSWGIRSRREVAPARGGWWRRFWARDLSGVLFALFVVTAAADAGGAARIVSATHLLAGTWSLEAAYDLLADGRRGEPYGLRPIGLLIVDADGRYSLQIFHTVRTPFANEDKQRATAEEYRAATMGMSTHFGRIDIDDAQQTLTFRIERAAFPNWDGRAQVRPFELRNDVLSYRVPKTPTGATPVSVWRRVARFPAGE